MVHFNLGLGRFGTEGFLFRIAWFDEQYSRCQARLSLRGGGGGEVQGNYSWRIRFELWAPQVPLIIGETFGEVLGPRRQTVSELRPAQKLGRKIVISPRWS